MLELRDDPQIPPSQLPKGAGAAQGVADVVGQIAGTAQPSSLCSSKGCNKVLL